MKMRINYFALLLLITLSYCAGYTVRLPGLSNSTSSQTTNNARNTTASAYGNSTSNVLKSIDVVDIDRLKSTVDLCDDQSYSGYGFLKCGPKSKSVESKKPACCYGPFIKSCTAAMIDVDRIGNDTLDLPGRVTVLFKEYINGNPNHFYYEARNNAGSSLVITLNPDSRSIHGHAILSTGQSFALEYCGDDTHVFKEYDSAKFEEATAIDLGLDVSAFQDLSTDDSNTVVEYSAQVYYTSEFEANTPDIQGFVDQVIAETNQGYKNSQIPLKLKLHCLEKANIKEVASVVTMIMNFKEMKGSVEALRNSADVAVLLVDSFDSCGVGFVYGIAADMAVSVVQKSCAVGYYSFGHEIGHNIGLHHNKEKASNNYFNTGYGFLVAGGYRTILAYAATGHQTRINYYSNPDVKFNGKVTGNRQANNAAVIIKNRFHLAAIGDESKACASPTSSYQTTPATEAPSYCPIHKDKGIKYRFQMVSGTSNAGDCRDACKFGECVQWMWRHHSIGGMCYHLSSYYIDSYGFSSGELDCDEKPTCQMFNNAGLAYTTRQIKESHAAACRSISCPKNSVCKLFSFEESTKTCHVIITYGKSRDGYVTGTPCA